MNRNFFSIVVACTLIAGFAAMAFAWGGGNGRKGKYLYRKNCRSCHDGSSAAELSPVSKTQAEWTKIFENVEALPCYGDWPSKSEGDVNDVFTYLHDHAKDSPSPAKCS